MAVKLEYRCLTVEGSGPDKHHHYLIVDKETGREYGSFHLIEAPFLRPLAGCKHLQLHINTLTLMEVEERGDITLLLKIFEFAFNSILKITHEKGYSFCKLYSNEQILARVYQKFAEKLNKKQYDVKLYGNWVEIKRKNR